MTAISNINSLSDYTQEICSIQLDNDFVYQPPELLFRGHADKEYEIIPAVGRLPSERWLNSWQMVEQGLIQSAQQKFPAFFNETELPVILLAKLQHYGIQTRMLDLTNNALVALFFACRNHDEKDGEVLAFSAKPVSAYNRYANAIADTYRLTNNAYTPTEVYYKKAIKQAYFSDYIPSEKHSKDVEQFAKDISKPMFIEVGNACERQRNQGGYFLLFPNMIVNSAGGDLKYGDMPLTSTYEYYKSDLTNILVRFEKENAAIVKRIIIPATIKKNILKELNLFGINEEFLFGDNIDEVCKCISEKYLRYYN